MIDPKTQYSNNALQELAQFERPIPGLSLTNDPDSPLPFEGPPIHTELASAIDEIIVRLCDPEVFHPIIDSLRFGVSVGEITEQLLVEGFSKGQWNTDLMLLLVEPTMYILIALTDMVGFEPRIDDEEEDSPEKQISNLEKIVDIAKEKIVPSRIPIDIKSKVEKLTKDIELSPQSLLSKEEI
jgi:hypothetical protein|tara:strand:- start:607 stop:1155 length:549 start_codon:yes stop_codon:yes gene_type:complete